MVVLISTYVALQHNLSDIEYVIYANIKHTSTLMCDIPVVHVTN